MPAIIAAQDAHRADGLVVLFVNLTDQETLRAVRAFVNEFRVPSPVLLDERGRTRRLYRLRGVPTSVFVGTDGVVRAVHPGPISDAALQQHLGEILPAR